MTHSMKQAAPSSMGGELKKILQIAAVVLLAIVPLRAQVMQQAVVDSAAPVAAAGITIVQHKSTFCVAITCTLVFPLSVAAGDQIYCATAANGNVLNACTCNNSNTLVNVDSVAGPARLDFVSSANAGATSCTANSTATTRTYIDITETSGIAGTIDKHANATQAGTNQSISTGTATTAANEFVFGLLFDQPNNDSLTVVAPYTKPPAEFVDGGASNESLLVEVKIVSVIAIQTAAATCGSATNTVGQIIATFK
jgi:hypothetical protein